MRLEIAPASAQSIQPLRDQYLLEMSAQVVHFSWLDRGLCEPLAIQLDNAPIGYALIAPAIDAARPDQDGSIIEFFLDASQRAQAASIFRRLLETAKPRTIIAQTNDALLAAMVRDHAHHIEPRAWLFADDPTKPTASEPPLPDARFRHINPSDRQSIFTHHAEPVGDWCIEIDDTIVATGGFLTHYNPPFADLYMEVDERFRRRGLGSMLIRELRRLCVSSALVPAARCRIDNVASRACLLRGGMRDCGQILHAKV